MFVVPAVCRRWRDLCSSAVAVDLDFQGRIVCYTNSPQKMLKRSNITPMVADVFTSRFDFVRSVNFSNNKHITDVTLTALASKSPRVQHINLSMCRRITDTSIESIAAWCPHLISLTLNKCLQVTDSALVKIGIGCLNIESIKFSHG